jgi:leucyl-tRNA synthetase
MKNVVVMFPYPSGAGLHLGHYYNYAIIDSYCRFLRYDGEEVFQPFGYDAFGLPAENYARSIGGDPKEVTLGNIERFRNQMIRMNTLYDERLVTCLESYTKWTQWVFNKLHERGLAYKANGMVNYCPSCATVLANEQVKEDHCDRCSSKVEHREMNQWYFKITDYKDRLIAGLDHIDYPEGTIKQQRRWLENLQDWCVSRQRKWGCPIPIEGETDTLDTFVDSSFYFLRYLTDSQDEFLPAGAYKPVDLYVGGVEHACMHLIYARFIHYFLFDIGMVPQEEPFNKVVHQGMITRNGAKMGKSKGNALDPDDYDSDELRMFLMFLGPYEDGGDWNDKGIKGIRRFLNRMKTWLREPWKKDGTYSTSHPDQVDVQGLKDLVRQYLFSWKVNKIISTFMTFYNENKDKKVSPADANEIAALLKNFAPGFRL